MASGLPTTLPPSIILDEKGISKFVDPIVQKSFENELNGIGDGHGGVFFSVNVADSGNPVIYGGVAERVDIGQSQWSVKVFGKLDWEPDRPHKEVGFQINGKW